MRNVLISRDCAAMFTITMYMLKTKIIKLSVLLLLLPLVGIGCKNSGTISKDSLESVSLNYWRVFDEPSDFTTAIAKFRQTYPHISISVRKLRLDEYEDAILRALAEGNGPDVISFHVTWLNEYLNLLDPAPASVTLPASFSDGRSTTISLQTTKLPSVRDLRNVYVDTVSSDAVLGSAIYGLPLGVDTLVLYYNRQLLNQANIPSAPATWNEFKDQVKRLTAQDRNGNIIQSGASLGGARNINRAPDIIAALMMQNGTEMTNKGKVAFNQIPANINDKEVNPGRDAVRFYTDFASPAKEVYTWNENLPESLDAFANQQAAFFFGYSYHLPLIRALSPGIDIGITKLPQISTAGKQINIANYWLEGVTKQSPHKNEAWGFIQYITSEQGVGSFLEAALKPTALRTLIASQRQNQELRPFADQLLTATNWYHGNNVGAMEEAMRIMVEQVVGGVLTPQEAVNEAVKTINISY
jgi:multiple sugar transport system substrate-binding protein